MKLDLSAPHTTYHNSKGRRLVGVTTYCGGLAKEHLHGWYASEERAGVVRYMKEQRPLPTKADGKPLWFAEMKRDKAADLGTITHFRIEAWRRQEVAETTGLPPDLWSQSQHGLDRFVAWYREQGFKPVASEKKVIHERDGMEYGGTIDCLEVDSSMRKVLLDLKTSKASPWWPYDETYAQVAAYAEAEGGVERIIVCRVGKTPGDELQTVELTAREREAGWMLFRGAYAAYEAKRALAKARKGSLLPAH